MSVINGLAYMFVALSIDGLAFILVLMSFRR